MIKKILGISGRSDSGKSSISNFIHSLILPEIQITEDGITHPLVSWTKLDDEGDLVVPSEEDGIFTEIILHLNSDNPHLNDWLSKFVHPFVREYSPANYLKYWVNGQFNIPWENLFGTRAAKDKSVGFKLGNLYGKSPKGRSKDDDATVRDLLQWFDEKIRAMHEDIPINAVLKDIEESSTTLNIITGIRHINEVHRIHEKGGKVIRLLRNPNNDAHASETELSNLDNVFDFVLDNNDLTLSESCSSIHSKLLEWGYFEVNNA